MLKSQVVNALVSGVGCAALLVLGMSIVPSSSRAANDNNGSQDEKEMIQIGLSVAPANGIQLNMAGKDSDTVGLGSYLVNVVGDCNGCHSNGPAREWCCDANPVSANTDGTGNPYLLSPPFKSKKVNPNTYLGGGRDFGALSASGIHIFSRNLTPDVTGRPAGGMTLSEIAPLRRPIA